MKRRATGKPVKKKSLNPNDKSSEAINSLISPEEVVRDNEAIVESSDEEEEAFDPDEGTRYGNVVVPPPPTVFRHNFEDNRRLIITHMVLENFKSYANQVYIGPFHKNFGTIVGPNGSGKSNVIDAMLFVFGCRANRIRSKKLSNMVHLSAEYSNMKSCCVSVYFAEIIDVGEKEFREVPDTKFMISRTAFTNNSSFYTINDKKANFKEVTAKLRLHNIDLLYNRFLILQGEVESISLMKPKSEKGEVGMLEYIEDVIGTLRYREPLKKLEEQVKAAKDLYEASSAKFARVNNQRLNLEKPARESINFLIKENEYFTLKSKRLLRAIYENKKKQNEFLAEKTSIDEQFKNIEKQSTELKDKLAAYKKTESETKKMHDQMVADLEKKKAKKSALEKEKLGLEEDLNETKKAIKKLTASIKTEEKKLEKWVTIPENNESKVTALTEEKNDLLAKKKTLENKLMEIAALVKEETSDLQREKEKLHILERKSKNIFNEEKLKYELAKSEFKIYTESDDVEKGKLEKLRSDCHEIEKKSIQQEKDVGLKNLEIEQREKELADVNKQRDAKLGEEQTLLRKKEEYKTLLTEKREIMASSRSGNRVLNYMMNLKHKGIVNGIHGRLGDLGMVDAKYDVAVSTACGILDFIVVDHNDIAKTCIDHLKKDAVGRASFISLNMIEHYRKNCDTSPKKPENAKRLIDLIQLRDEKYRTAFYYGLHETLLAEDMDQATRLAFNQTTRNRVVTFNGDLIEASGAMTGGGKNKSKGRIATSFDKVVKKSANDSFASTGNVEQLEQSLADVENRLANLQMELDELNVSKLNNESRIAQLKAEILKLRNNLEFNEHRKTSLKEQITTQKRKVGELKMDKREYQRLESFVEKAGSAMNAAETDVNAKVEQIKSIEDQIKQIVESHNGTTNEDLTGVNERIHEIELQIPKLKTEIVSSKRNLEKSEQNIKKMRHQIEEKERRKLEIENKLEKLSGPLNESANTEEFETLQANIEEFAAKLKEICKEYSKINSELEAQKFNSEKLRQELEECNKKIETMRERNANREKELKAIKFHSVPIFQLNTNVKETQNGVKRTTDTPESVSLTDEQLEQLNTNDLAHQEADIKKELSTMTINYNIIKEYEQKLKEYYNQLEEVARFDKNRVETKQNLSAAQNNRFKEFITGFQFISIKVKEVYMTLAKGGDAELEVNSEDPFESGITYSIRPPTKSWKQISNLSGGEKTLASLAILFALHEYRPTPFYVMDEVDAALDYKNVSLVAYRILFIRKKSFLPILFGLGKSKEKVTKNAQFIVISLREGMYSKAKRLIGICKADQNTKTVTINVDNYGEP